ncbi:MAG: MOSC N-terminal beta barrel domain-containing protein [Pyrinomonadaceae bacterium]
MKLTEINIYPIKSLKGISVESGIVEPRGLRNDRRWMLIDGDGTFMTQRDFPQMATINIGIDDELLYVTADGFGTVELPLAPQTGDRRQLEVWGNPCEGEAYEAVINEWFSDAVGESCELVFMPDDARREISQLFNKGDEIVSFADGYPLLVIGEASLADLNTRILGAERLAGRLPAFRRLPMNRFRPNIVVDGSEAFAEDHWKRIRVGDAIFRATKPCARCVMTTVDQARGEFDGKEPLKTLASYRMAQHAIPDTYESLGMNATAVLFGQNLVGESFGATINVGDEVSVIE